MRADSLQSCPTLRPYGLQRSRLLCPWDSLGKNTGVGGLTLLQGIFLTWGLNPRLLWLLHWQVSSLPLVPPGKPIVDSMCLVTQSCLTLCDPMDCSPPGSFVHGDSPGKNIGVVCHALLQGISQPRNPTQVSHIAGRFFYHLSHQGSPPKRQKYVFSNILTT